MSNRLNTRFLTYLLVLSWSTYIVNNEKHTCKADICGRNARVYCPKTRVVLVLRVSCFNDRRCPDFVYKNIVAKCSFQTQWTSHNEGVVSVLCLRFRRIDVTYTCIPHRADIVSQSCNNEEIPRDAGFVVSRLYPAETRINRCKWTFKMAIGSRATVVVYDLRSSSLSQSINVTLTFSPNNHADCLPDSGSTMITTETALPSVVRFQCSSRIDVDLVAKETEVGVLFYYQVEQGTFGDPPVMPHSSLMSSCSSSRPIGTWFRILRPDEQSTKNYEAAASTREVFLHRHPTSSPLLATKITAPRLSEIPTKMLLIGIGSGFGLCGLLLVPLIIFCIRYLNSRRGKSSKTQKRVTSVNGVSSLKSFHFHECTFITDKPQDSPVYATIDDRILEPTNTPSLCDVYSDVADKLSNPPPPPSHVTKTGCRESVGGNQYTEIQLLEQHSSYSPNDYRDLPVHVKPQIGRSQSEPDKRRAVFVFPSVTTHL